MGVGAKKKGRRPTKLRKRKPRDKPLNLAEPLDFDVAIRGLLAAPAAKAKKKPPE